MTEAANPAKPTGPDRAYDKVELCAVPPTPDRVLGTDVAPFRASLIRYHEKKWVNGTVLHYLFFTEHDEWRAGSNQEQAVRDAFQQWKDLGIGLEFEEVRNPEEAEIRIGFQRGAGSWSYVGRDAVDYGSGRSRRTMNFGWDLTTRYGRDTALHEVGHALGFPHEHQNPVAGIVWDVAAVTREFSGPPNRWDEDTIRHNILRKIHLLSIEGSEWDPDSIMHYPFPAGLILKPERYREQPLIPEPGLSPTDVKQVRAFYPPLRPALPELRPLRSATLTLAPGEQADFLVRPGDSREYTIRTFGAADSVLVLFERIDGANRYVDGDDDSGADRNACMRQRLVRGRTYVVRLRLYHASRSGEVAVMLW